MASVYLCITATLLSSNNSIVRYLITTAAPKVKPHKFSAASVSKPVRENNTFGFLNKLEINKPAATASGSAGGAVNVSNAKKAAAHRNPNVSKLF